MEITNREQKITNVNYLKIIEEKMNISISSFIFLLVLGLLVYHPAISHQFQTLWDDQWVVVNYYTEAGLNLKNFNAILTEFYLGQYAPFNQLYYTFLFEIFGYNPYVFHTSSVLIHIINSFLVYILIKRLLPLSKTKLINNDLDQKLALLSATMFIIHPISVETVAWISASKVLLYSLFYLMSLITYTSYLSAPSISKLIIVAVWFILSFGAKEQAVTLPLCLLLIDILSGRSFKNKNVLLEKIPFIIIALFFGYVTMQSQAEIGVGLLSEKDQYPLHQRLVFACYSSWEYFTKAVLPINLSYIYPFPNQIGEALPTWFWLYPIAISAALVIFGKYFKHPWLFFSGSFFILHLGLVLHIIPISRFAIIADRYLYVALISVCFVVSLITLRAITKFNNRKHAATLTMGVALYLFTMAFYSSRRSTVWKDSDTLKKELRSIIQQRADFNIITNK